MDRCCRALRVHSVRGIPLLSRAVGVVYDRLWALAEQRGGAVALAFLFLAPLIDAIAAVALASAVAAVPT